MRKRSKTRISQADKPWIRVRALTKRGRSLTFALPGKFLIWRTINNRESRYFKALHFLQKKCSNDGWLQKSFLARSFKGFLDTRYSKEINKIAKTDETAESKSLAKVKEDWPTALKKKLSKSDIGFFQKFNSYRDKVHQFSSLTKLRNFCLVQGKSRSFLRDFGLNRHAIKKISRCSAYLTGFRR